jgi:hypothetical protein
MDLRDIADCLSIAPVAPNSVRTIVEICVEAGVVAYPGIEFMC